MATRMYFPKDIASPVQPTLAANGAWTYTAEEGTRRLERRKTDTTLGNFTTIGPFSSGTGLSNRYVTDPLAAQTISGTVSMQVRAIEGNANDNLVSQLEIYAVALGGSGVTGTLLSIGHYANNSEFSAVTLTNKAFASGTTLTALAVNRGDRLVIAVGGGVAPNASDFTLNLGDQSDTADLPQDDSTTTALDPWIEFSANLVFLNSVMDWSTNDIDGAAAGTSSQPTYGGSVLSKRRKLA